MFGRRPSSESDLERRRARIKENIRTYGVHIAAVIDDENHPKVEFCYTIGLLQRFEHPEISLFGLDVHIAAEILNDAAQQISVGRSFSDNAVDNELFVGVPATFKAMTSSSVRRYLGQAVDFYAPAVVIGLQLVWPDVNVRFPWQIGYKPLQTVSQPSTWS